MKVMRGSPVQLIVVVDSVFMLQTLNKNMVLETLDWAFPTLFWNRQDQDTNTGCILTRK